MEIKTLNDLKRHTKPLEDKIVEAIADVAKSGWFVLGSEVSKFESDFSSYCGAKSCVSVANGTEALEIALKAVGVARGEKVACVANAGFYSATAIYACHANPVFVDIDPDFLTMSAKSFESVVRTAGLKAVIVTHLYGQMADIKTICSIAAQYGVVVIEDCAQSHGAVIDGKRAGTFGSVGCFSFYPTKNLGALGDGGAIVTSDPVVFENAKKIRQYGWSSKYHVAQVDCRNSRLDEIQAAVLNVKLGHLDDWNEKRRQIVKVVKEKCRDLKEITFPISTGLDYVGHLFVVRTSNRENLRAHLAKRGIISDIHYPLLDYQQKAISDQFENFSLPVAETENKRILTLPCFPEMTEDEVEYMANALIEFEKKSV